MVILTLCLQPHCYLDGMAVKRTSWTICAGPEVYLQSSFNHTFLPHVAAKVGITYKLNNHE
ncbi:MAG: hypothetical protein R2879_04615 [Saprospiraceae bacterium]